MPETQEYEDLIERLEDRAVSYDQSSPSASHTADLLREASAALRYLLADIAQVRADLHSAVHEFTLLNMERQRMRVDLATVEAERDRLAERVKQLELDVDRFTEGVVLGQHLTAKAEARVKQLEEALGTLLSCPAIADENHDDPEWGCHETAAAIRTARTVKGGSDAAE